MGILGRALAGLGEGLVDVGKSQIDFGNKQALMNQENDLMMQRQRTVELLKEEVANRQRAQMQSSVMGSIDKEARANFDPASGDDVESYVKSQQANPGVIARAALAQGYPDYAKTAKLIDAEDKPVAVSPGSVLVDPRTGEAKYDNTELYRESLKARSSGNGKLSPIIGEARKSMKDTVDAIDSALKDRTDPYGAMTADNKPKADSAYANLLKAAAVDYSRSGTLQGQLVSGFDAMNKVQPVLDDYDKLVRNTGEQIADMLFDAKGKPKTDTLIQNFKGTGIDVSNKNDFLSTFRNSYLRPDRFSKFLDPAARQGVIEALNNLPGKYKPEEKPKEKGIIKNAPAFSSRYNGMGERDNEDDSDFSKKNLNNFDVSPYLR